MKTPLRSRGSGRSRSAVRSWAIQSESQLRLQRYGAATPFVNGAGKSDPRTGTPDDGKATLVTSRKPAAAKGRGPTRAGSSARAGDTARVGGTVEAGAPGPAAVKPLRADARRNRARVLEAAE